MAADLFSQSCRLHNIRDSWQNSVQCLVEEAHDLERGRKESEQLTGELRHHMDSFGKQFDKIRDQVKMPDPPATTTTTTTTGQQQQQQQQQQKENCYDETIEKELSELHAQIEDTKRRMASLASGAAPAQPVPGTQATSDSCPPPTAVTAAALADFTKSPPTRRTSRDLFLTVGNQPQAISANMDHNHKCWSEGPVAPGGQQHGDVMSSWRTPPNMINRNVLEHECGWTPPPLPPRKPVTASFTDLSIQEVEKGGKYVRIVNRSSTKEEQLGCCTLQQSVNGNATVIFRFPPCVTLPALGTLNVWSASGTCDRDSPDVNFRFRELKAWGTGSDYTTVLRRANGQVIAFIGGAGRAQLQDGDNDACEADVTKAEAKVPLVKNSMPGRLNSNKSDCIQVQKPARFTRRVITSTGETGKPQCGFVKLAPGSCDAYRRLISDV